MSVLYREKYLGIGIFIGHPSVQYEQAVQGIVIELFIIPTTLSRISYSSCDRGSNSFMYEVLSSSCSILLMPLRTTFTLSRLATKRIAQEATDISGWYALSRASASGGTFARIPPLTGSITTTSIPCLTAAS